jgi:5'-3' exonuclease
MYEHHQLWLPGLHSWSCLHTAPQGTEFMLLLAEWLRSWAADKVRQDDRFTHTAFTVSDASEPGEQDWPAMHQGCRVHVQLTHS